MFKYTAAAIAVAAAFVSQASFADDALTKAPVATVSEKKGKSADTNSYGTLSRTDYHKWLMDRGLDPRNSMTAGDKTSVDTTKNGVVTLAGTETKHTLNTDPNTLFNRADANRDGVLNAGEQATLKKLVEQDLKKEGAKYFASLDTNHDGYITREEAAIGAPALAENWNKVDVNHDGKITPAELDAAIKRHIMTELKSKMSAASSSSGSTTTAAASSTSTTTVAAH